MMRTKGVLALGVQETWQTGTFQTENQGCRFLNRGRKTGTARGQVVGFVLTRATTAVST